MSRMQRRKGQVGEREAAALVHAHTGLTVQRRVPKGAGDRGLVGVAGRAP